MSQQLQELINKIKSEGVEVAQKKAQEVEAAAQKKAQQIVQEAQAKAGKLIADAKEEIQKKEAASQMALTQAARNTLLNLRKEIESILKKIVLQNVGEALSSEQLFHLLEVAVKNYLQTSSNGASMEVSLNPQDAARLKEDFLAKLKQHIKQPVHVKASDEMGKGFVISFDGGKSSFDFSDESLAEYVSAYVNQELAKLLKEAYKK